MMVRRTSIAWLLGAVLLPTLAVEAAGVEICQRRARRCSTPPSPSSKSLHEPLLAAARPLARGELIEVPVAYHVVYGSYRPRPGEEADDREHAPPLALTARQTQALNRAFRGTGFSFVTAEATLHDFAPWDDPQTAPGEPPATYELVPMIRDLTAGRTNLLHVFLLRHVENRAAPPETKSMFEDVADADGIVMDWDYLPYVESLRPISDRRLRRYYFEGETLVHLVGHYAGLLHTFEEPQERGDCYGTCGRTTDFVRDTPVHRWTWGERGSRCRPADTCPDFPGMDPMTNYMNLEPDLCASEFTPGQVQRMQRMVRAFRPYLVVPAATHHP